MAARIPYKLVGGTSLLDSALVRDALAYCKLALNLRDDPSFMRIVNKPARRLGEALFSRCLPLADTSVLLACSPGSGSQRSPS